MGCTDINECRTAGSENGATIGQLSNSGSSVDIANACIVGSSDATKKCAQSDGTATTPCVTGAVCENLTGGYRCVCPLGTYGNGYPTGWADQMD
jgi:hypothetical protein